MKFFTVFLFIGAGEEEEGTCTFGLREEEAAHQIES
jgi:hypothetical protein